MKNYNLKIKIYFITLLCGFFGAILIDPRIAFARQLPSFPMYENFDTAIQYSDIVCNDPGVSSQSFVPTGGWQGSGASKFTFVNGPEDNSGLCNLVFPPALFPRRVNIRWLVFYGPEFFEVAGGFGGKNMILRRCNSDCSGEIVPFDERRASAFRGMVLGEVHQMICENIECADYVDLTLPGKAEFRSDQYFNQWVSYEAEFDLENSVSKLYIDTQDGTQNSQGGTSPYQTYTDWDTTNAWLNLDWLMGYWEQRMNAGPEGYFKIDELVIDDNYIGPPTGFVGSIPVTPPPPPQTRVPVSVPAPNPAGHTLNEMLLMVGSNRGDFSWGTTERAVNRIDYGLSTAYGQEVIWWGDDRAKEMSLIRLSPNTAYYYRITSTEVTGGLTQSIVTGSFTTLTSSSDITPPSAPSGLSVI